MAESLEGIAMILKTLWFHWRGVSAAIFETLNRIRFNGISLGWLMLAGLFFVGLPHLLLPFQAVPHGASLSVKLYDFAWAEFSFGLTLCVHLILSIDALVKEGIIFQESSNDIPAKPIQEIDSTVSEGTTVHVFGEFSLNDDEKQSFHRVPSGIHVDRYGGFTLIARVDASVRNSFMLIPTGTTRRLGELIIQYSSDARLNVRAGWDYWGLRRDPALLITSEANDGTKSVVCIVVSDTSARDAIAEVLSVHGSRANNKPRPLFQTSAKRRR